MQVILGLSAILQIANAETRIEGPPHPPQWPLNFVTTAVQNRSGDVALTTFFYDWPGGRNLILIAKQPYDVLWDLEWTNGTSFYFNREVMALYSMV